MEKFDLTLLDFLKNEANKDVDGYANQILTILKVLTRYKILHRDFLASNFMVNNQGTIKIIDFGLAYDRDTPSSKTQYNAPLLTEELNQYTNINLFISQLGHEIKESKTARIFLKQDDPFKSFLNIVLPKLQNILEFVKNHNT
jgi:serine/threonine protein kinase